MTSTFGVFDHIESIPGTPTSQLFKDRLELIRMADQAGFAPTGDMTFDEAKRTLELFVTEVLPQLEPSTAAPRADRRWAPR